MKSAKFISSVLPASLLLAADNSYSQGPSTRVESKQVSLSPTLEAATHYANVDDHKIGYRRFGEGTPLILIDRFRGTLDTWNPLFLDLLAKQNTVITFDQSGIAPEGQEVVLNRYFAPVPSIVEDAENFRAAYVTLKTPVLVMSGDHDISFSFENWYPIIGKAPATQFLVLLDAGHDAQDQYLEFASG